MNGEEMELEALIKMFSMSNHGSYSNNDNF